MNGLATTLLEIAGFLESRQIPYMVIGGFANLHWGRPRLTEDLDITVQVPEESWEEFISSLQTRFRTMAEDPLRLARDTRVIPISATHARIDLILAGLPYEEEAIRRAVRIPIESNTVSICSAEDLILHKLVSERPRDHEDVEGVILRQAKRLDRGYLDPRVHELALVLERPSIEAFYRECIEKALR